jgi:hypothetical protein
MSYYDVDEDSRSAMPGFLARKDCERINRENEILYSKSQKAAANEFKELVDQAFFRRRTFLNFRTNFIAIKVEAPQKLDMISSEYRAVLAYAEANKIKAKTGKASIIFEYRFEGV